jgi:hypothetical protein
MSDYYKSTSSCWGVGRKVPLPPFGYISFWNSQYLLLFPLENAVSSIFRFKNRISLGFRWRIAFNIGGSKALN